MAKTVRIELTLPEAKALLRLAENSDASDEDAVAILIRTAAVSAGRRAQRKLERAIGDAGGWIATSAPPDDGR